MFLELLLCFIISLNFCQSADSSTCPDDFTYHEKSRKCFLLLSGEPMSQMNARLNCAKRGAFLASIHSDEENNAITDLLSTNKVQKAYIALQSKTYSITERFWTDGTPVNYLKWMNGKPDNGDFADDGCTIISVNDGTWDDWSCEPGSDTALEAAVCQIMKCPEGFEYFSETNNCYKIITQQAKMSQIDAENECKKYGAHLVSINSEAENQFISNLAMRNPYSAIRLYIGLKSKSETDASDRHWVDGDAVVYTNWDKTKPSNEPYDKSNCVVLHPDQGGVWSDWACAPKCNKCPKWSVFGAACEIE